MMSGYLVGDYLHSGTFAAGVARSPAASAEGTTSATKVCDHRLWTSVVDGYTVSRWEKAENTIERFSVTLI